MNVSVLITCYNRATRVCEAVRSALEQTLAPREILVVDDGSTDDSPKILASFGSRIRVIRTPNRGFSRALNLGVSEATAEWIAFLDSDDVWFPQKLELQAKALQTRPSAALAFCDIEVVRGNSVTIPSRFALGGVYGAELRREKNVLHFDRSLFLHMIDQSRIFTSAVLAKRDLPDLVFPENFRCCVDWPVWMNLVLRYPFVAVDHVLVRMHYDGDNLTARVGRILRNNIVVFEKLLRDETLTQGERAAVEQALRERRFGAMYHSLLEGDRPEARKLLAGIPRRALPPGRWWVYWLAAQMPAGWLRRVAAWRLGDNGSRQAV